MVPWYNNTEVVPIHQKVKLNKNGSTKIFESSTYEAVVNTVDRKEKAYCCDPARRGYAKTDFHALSGGFGNLQTRHYFGVRYCVYCRITQESTFRKAYSSSALHRAKNIPKDRDHRASVLDRNSSCDKNSQHAVGIQQDKMDIFRPGGILLAGGGPHRE